MARSIYLDGERLTIEQFDKIVLNALRHCCSERQAEVPHEVVTTRRGRPHVLSTCGRLTRQAGPKPEPM